MAVFTDITIIPKKTAELINPAVISEAIMSASQALGCYTFLGEENPLFDRKVSMSFVDNVMIGRFPLFYPYAYGEITNEPDCTNYTERTLNIYYALGSIDREGFEGCPEAFQTMNDFVTVGVHSNDSGEELINGIGLEILKLSENFRIFFRSADTDNDYKELFI